MKIDGFPKIGFILLTILTFLTTTSIIAQSTSPFVLQVFQNDNLALLGGYQSQDGQPMYAWATLKQSGEVYYWQAENPQWRAVYSNFLTGKEFIGINNNFSRSPNWEFCIVRDPVTDCYFLIYTSVLYTTWHISSLYFNDIIGHHPSRVIFTKKGVILAITPTAISRFHINRAVESDIDCDYSFPLRAGQGNNVIPTSVVTDDNGYVVEWLQTRDQTAESPVAISENGDRYLVVMHNPDGNDIWKLYCGRKGSYWQDPVTFASTSIGGKVTLHRYSNNLRYFVGASTDHSGSTRLVEFYVNDDHDHVILQLDSIPSTALCYVRNDGTIYPFPTIGRQ